MFFQSINTMMAAGTDLSINIRKVGEQLVVSTLPRNNNLKGEAQSYLIPLMVTGTPIELDAGFLQAILQPIQKAGGLLINLEQFEKQAQATASKTKSEKPKLDKEANEGKEKRENYEKCLKKADELTSVKRHSEALTYLKQAKTFATPMQLTDLAKKIKATELVLTQGSLFGTEETPEVQHVPQQPQPIPMVQQVTCQPQQPDYYQQPVWQPQPVQQPVSTPVTSQPMQQPVIHPAQFPVTANGQSLARPVQQRPAGQTFFGQENGQYGQQPTRRPALVQQQSGTQPAYNTTSWNSDGEETGTTGFREDPYAGYPDFPEECRMCDETQMAAVY